MAVQADTDRCRDGIIAYTPSCSFPSAKTANEFVVVIIIMLVMLDCSCTSVKSSNARAPTYIGLYTPIGSVLSHETNLCRPSHIVLVKRLPMIPQE